MRLSCSGRPSWRPASRKFRTTPTARACRRFRRRWPRCLPSDRSSQRQKPPLKRPAGASARPGRRRNMRHGHPSLPLPPANRPRDTPNGGLRWQRRSKPRATGVRRWSNGTLTARHAGSRWTMRRTRWRRGGTNVQRAPSNWKQPGRRRAGTRRQPPQPANRLTVAQSASAGEAAAYARGRQRLFDARAAADKRRLMVGQRYDECLHSGAGGEGGGREAQRGPGTARRPDAATGSGEGRSARGGTPAAGSGRATGGPSTLGLRCGGGARICTPAMRARSVFANCPPAGRPRPGPVCTRRSLRQSVPGRRPMTPETAWSR